MIRNLVFAGIVLIGIALVTLAFFDPALRTILAISGSMTFNGFRGGRLFLHSLENGTGFGFSGFIVGTFLGFGLAVVGLILAVIGLLARPSHRVNAS